MDALISVGEGSEADPTDSGHYDWMLTREKVGLSHKGGVDDGKRIKEQSDSLHLEYIRNNFRRFECVRFEDKSKSSKTGICHCGLQQEQHLKKEEIHSAVTEKELASGFQPGHMNEGFDASLPENETLQLHELKQRSSPFHLPNILTPVEERNLYTPPPPPLLETDGITVRRQETLPLLEKYERTAATNVPDASTEEAPVEGKEVVNSMAGGDGEGVTKGAGYLKRAAEPPEGGGNGKHLQWSRETCLRELPTNAYGRINFTNETAGLTKRAKYLRLSHKTPMDTVLRYLVDYWHITEPQHPDLVISVIGGAKNFRLDGKKKETFTSGLISAVKSTGALLLTGGTNVGATRSVGEAVNQGQYLVEAGWQRVVRIPRESLVTVGE